MISGAKLGATWCKSRYMFEEFCMFYNMWCIFSFRQITSGVGRLVSWSVYFRALIWVDFVMLKYFFIYIYNIIYIDKSSEQSGMHGVYKTDQLTNWPIGAAFSEGIRGFGRGEKMFEGKSRNVWKMGSGCTRDSSSLRSSEWHWIVVYRFFHHVIQNGTKCSEGSRVHKGGCVSVDAFRSFASLRMTRGCFAQDDMTWQGSVGRLVSWSVSMHALIISLHHEERWVYSEYPIKKKKIWWCDKNIF